MAKIALYYFTGTGNSLAISQKLNNVLPDSTLFPVIKNGKIASLDQDAEVVGIIFPVYMWAVPLAVEEFVKINNFKDSTYLFAVATYGGGPGYAVPYLNDLLKAKNKKLNSSFGFLMPANYTPLGGAWSTEKQQKTIAKADQKITSVAQIISQRAETKLVKNMGPVGWLLSQVYRLSIIKKVPTFDKKFSTLDNCNGCGKCAKVCPVNNIVIKDQKPEWLHHCQQCFACLQACPVEALQCGRITKGRKRYRYPDYNFKGHNF